MATVMEQLLNNKLDCIHSNIGEWYPGYKKETEKR